MDRTTLLQRLRQGEREDFEVKSARRGVSEDAFRTVAAFANTSGGWLVFGARETPTGFEPVGVDAASRFDKPLRVRERGHWVAYLRRASGDHRCTEEEEARMVRDAALETYDSLPLEGTGVVDLDGESLRWARGRLLHLGSAQAMPEKDDAAFLRALGLAGRDGALTRAAALLFGEPALVTALKPAGLVDLRVHLTAWAGDAARPLVPGPRGPRQPGGLVGPC